MIAIVVIMLFFITSADSCSLVVDVLGHGGRSETPCVTRVFWSVLVGLSGGVLLLADGESALTVLQVTSLAGAAPLSIVYTPGIIALWKVFRYEMAVMPRYVAITSTDGENRAPRGTTSRAVEAPAGRRRGMSVSLAGLDSDVGTTPAPSFTPGSSIVAVRDVPPEAVSAPSASGAVSIDEEAAPHDPLGGEVFDTPEFRSSAAGAAHEDNDSGAQARRVEVGAAR